MEGVLAVMIMVTLGYILAKKGFFTEETAKIIPQLVIKVSLPVYMLWNLTSIFDHTKLLSLFFGLAVPFTSMFLCCVLGCFISNLLTLPPARIGIFRAVFFCSNTVFIGIPVNLALFGDVSTPFVLMYFFANACFFWTAGNYFIGRSGPQAGTKLFSLQSLKNIFSPPMLGVIFAVILILFELRLPDFLANTARQIGSMTTPLSLIFVGVVIFGIKLKDIRFTKDVIAILTGRFIISPMTVLLVASLIPIPLLMKKVFVIQSALPAMTQVTLIAKQHEADTEYAALLTAITTLAATLVIPFYMVIL
jgi:predicted permease